MHSYGIINTTFLESVLALFFEGHEGRIGMAAITIKKGEELHCKKMFSHVASYLPAYAQPRFIRIQVAYLTLCSEFDVMLNIIYFAIGCKKSSANLYDIFRRIALRLQEHSSK